MTTRASLVFAGLCSLAACRPPIETLEPDEARTATHDDELTPEQIIAASNLPPIVPIPLDGDPMGVTVHRLDNGLTVYISTNRQQPRLDAWIVVRAGSRNDPPHSTGLAHYLEHMLFKGTDEFGTLDLEAEREHIVAIEQLYAKLRGADETQRAQIFADIDRHTQATAAYAIPNEFDRMYSVLGVEGVNAFTSDEITAYIADVPANRFDAWAEVEAERFADPVFRLFYPELEAVYEEKNLSLDDPDDRVWEALLLGLFPAHPYGTQPTIGLTEHLKTPAYSDMVEYFDDWYVPNNMAVVLAGDIDAERALPVLEATLGRLQPRELPSLDVASVVSLEPVTGRIVKEVLAEAEQTVTMAWRTVPIRHADEPALVVLDWLADNSQAGLLDIELELTQKVQDATSWVGTYNEAGYFGMEATLQQGQTHAEVEALLLGVVKKLVAGEFTAEEVEAIKLHQDIADKYRLEDNEARVELMAESFIARASWGEVLERDRRLRAVTREDVIRVASEYLGDDYVVVQRKSGVQAPPNIGKPAITPIEIDPARTSPFAERILASPATALVPEWLRAGEHYVEAQLPAGPLIAARNTRNDLFTLTYRFERGHRKERLLCFALELLPNAGSGSSSAAQLQKQLFALGTTVGFRCDADGSSIDISGIDRNLEQSVRLAEAWFRSPNFDQATLTGVRTNILSARADQLDDPDMLGWLLADYAQYGSKATALTEPSNAELRRATAKQLSKLLTSYPDYRHRTLYFGPRSAAEVASLLEFGDAHRDPGRRHVDRYRASEGVTIYFLHKDVAKSTISVVIPQGKQSREQRPAAEYFGQYLGGGMSSLIFQEIREARALAYYAYAYVATGTTPEDDWALAGGLGTQADKTAGALSVYLSLLRDRPIDDARLADALESLDSQYRSSRVDPRWITYWVDSWRLRGESEDPRPWQWAQIQNLDSHEVAAFAKSYADRPVLVSIVGDRNRVDMEALAKLGKVVEVKAADLVSYGAF